MITSLVQRWRDRRGCYRLAGEPIDTSRYEVVAIDKDAPAKAFVQAHHYSASYPAARFRFGLYRGAELVGVAVFSQPVNANAKRRFPGEPLESVDLGRLVLLDDVPANGESWFVARAFDCLRREGIIGIQSFSDPLARTDDAGKVVFKGHIGNVYQALSAVYDGRAKPDTLLLLPDGRAFDKWTKKKLLTGERGRRYAAAILERHGAAPLGDGEDAVAWLARWLPRLTRAVRHPGNHRYLWGLTRAAKKALPPSKSYPKFETSEAAA